MQADEVGRPGARLGQPGDRQGRGVGGEDGIVGEARFGGLGHRGLDRPVLEHRLDHQIAAVEVGIVVGRRDAAEQGGGLFGAHPALFDPPFQRCGGAGLAVLGRGPVDIHQYAFDAAAGARRGDPAAHHAGAENADLADLRFRHAGRPRLQLARLGHLEKAGADHRLGHRMADHLDEIFTLDPEADIDVALAALVDAGQDRLDRGVVAEAALPPHGVGGREKLQAGRALHVAAGQPEALAVPGLGRVGVVQRPAFRGVEQFVRRHDRVDQAEFRRLGDRVLAAVEQHLEAGLQPEHARDALGAAAARQYAEADFRQADARLRIVRRDPVMAAQRGLVAAAERMAVDRRDEGLAAGLHRPADPVEHQELGQQGLDAQILEEAVDIGAGDEIVLGRGDDDALHRVVGDDPFDLGPEAGYRGLVHHVDRTVRDVPCDDRDAVAVDAGLEHGGSPSGGVAQAGRTIGMGG